MENCYFKYTSFNTDTIKSILCNEIWFSSVEQFNDPFELFFKAKTDFPTDHEEFIKYLVSAKYFAPDNHRERAQNAVVAAKLSGNMEKLYELTKANIANLEASLEESLVEIGLLVSCMSKVRSQPLMWSHYANSYKGLCIAYDIEELKSVGIEFKSVTYQEKVFEFDPAVHFLSLSTDRKKASQTLTSILTTKNANWKYEEEVRSMRTLEDERDKKIVGKAYNVPEDSIKYIILGYRVPEKDRALLKRIAQVKNIPLYIASPKKGEYSVSIEEYRD